MDRKRVLHKSEFISLHDLDGKNLSEFIDEFTILQSKYEKECFNNDLNVVIRVDYDYDGAELYLDFMRWETDAECNSRVEKNRKAKEKAKKARETMKKRKQEKQQKEKDAEYQNYLKLKEKYESPN